MTEKEICRMYRQAKNRDAQLNVLADLNGINGNEAIWIPVKNGGEPS